MRDHDRLASFRLTNRLLAAARAKAARDGTSVSELVRSALHRETELAA